VPPPSEAGGIIVATNPEARAQHPPRQLPSNKELYARNMAKGAYADVVFADDEYIDPTFFEMVRAVLRSFWPETDSLVRKPRRLEPYEYEDMMGNIGSVDEPYCIPVIVNYEGFGPAFAVGTLDEVYGRGVVPEEFVEEALVWAVKKMRPFGYTEGEPFIDGIWSVPSSMITRPSLLITQVLVEQDALQYLDDYGYLTTVSLLEFRAKREPQFRDALTLLVAQYPDLVPEMRAKLWLGKRPPPWSTNQWQPEANPPPIRDMPGVITLPPEQQTRLLARPSDIIRDNY
jgi:hypothetical protein